jgi:hypothetical protein
VQTSSTSQIPVIALQTVFGESNWQLEQHDSRESSHTALSLYLQVVGSQQELFPQDCSPPQSQSSPASTIPFPHWLPVMVVTLRLALRQAERIVLRPKAEQILPIEQGEKSVILLLEDGLMRYRPPVSQIEVESGQHAPDWQPVESQSWTAPKV